MTDLPRSDVAVVGGGLVGLATALAVGCPPPWGLARSATSVIVLEREETLAAHQSGHNSGVIHSGLYYRPGSAKAQTCTEGRDLLYRFCAEEGIPHEACGKVVVATTPEEIPRLEALESRGRANGLPGLERLTPEGIREREPHAAGIDGLWVPTTGIVDYGAVAAAYARRVREAGGTVRTGARVVGVERRGGEIILETTAGPVACRQMVGCAGLWSDRLARLCGLDPGVRITPFRGEYQALVPERRHLVRNLIYPVPDPQFPFLGVHFTRGVDGTVEAGPNAVLALARDGYSWSRIVPRDLLGTLTDPGFLRLAARHWRMGMGEVVRSWSRRAFVRALQRLLPELRVGDVHPHGAGVRAQAVDRRGNLLDDFHIVRAEGMVHVLNAPSPAATASIAIGRRIAAMLEG
jgi:L-2-hydroxyglutarate oxidase